MYYLAKLAQASGLTVILVGYALSFPDLMSRKVLLLGIILFAFGWIIDRFLLRN